MSDLRNFRSSYLERVGIKGVEEKKSLEIVLKEQPVDSAKLSQFCLRYSVPVTYRTLVWKILLGVLPLCTEAGDFVWKQRQIQHDDLLQTVQIVCQDLKGGLQKEVHLRMHLIEQGLLPLTEEDLLKDPGNKAFIAIDQTMEDILEGSSAEIYWMTKSLYNLQKSFSQHIPAMIEHVEGWLSREECDGGALREHLSAMKAFQLLPLTEWFHCCYAGILPVSSIERIWDKVIAGSHKILVCVAVAILLTFRRPILSLHGIEDVNKYLQEIPEDSGDVIVVEALKMWQKHGCLMCSLPGSRESPNILEKSASPVHF